MKTVGVIGVGKLGARIAEQLALSGAFSTIYLRNRSADRQRGLVQSLNVWKGILQLPVSICNWENADAASLDIIVVAVKERYDPRMVVEDGGDQRTSGLHLDLPLVRNVCGQIRGYAGIVAVVTNPVDIMTGVVGSLLPRAQVVGLGLSVDAARLSYVLDSTSCGLFRFEDLPLVGEHGRSITPAWNRGAWPQLKRHEMVMQKYIERSIALGYEIVGNLGYTLHDCALTFGDDIEWLAKQPKDVERSVALVCNGRVAGGPTLWRGGSLQSVIDLPPDIQQFRQRVSEDVRIRTAGLPS